VSNNENIVEVGSVFVIMASHGDIDSTYQVIQEECNKQAKVAKLRNNNEGSSHTNLALIETAEFIICDLTHEDPNCYYELGYAHGAGNYADEILLIARIDTQLHFDISPFRVRYYSDDKDLRELVESNLRGMIKQAKENDNLTRKKRKERNIFNIGITWGTGDNITEGLVFLIISFNKDMDKTNSIIQEECKKLEFVLRRGDEGVGSNLILFDILDALNASELIICDLTHERPNCCYELGYTDAFIEDFEETLIIAKEDTKLQLNISPSRVKYYSNDDELRQILNTNL
jgi:hypothetical protein